VQQGLESKFHRFTLGFEASQAERLVHQFVVNYDIGAHNVYPLQHKYTL
jgi:hypothetical protein